MNPADDTTAGERGCRWSDARGRWERQIRPGVSKEACGHLAHTRGDDLYMPDERPTVVMSATPDADDTPPPAAGDVEATWLAEHEVALRTLWLDLAEKRIDLGIDWPYVVRTLFRDIDRIKAHDAGRDAVVWDEAVRAVANVDPAAIHNPYRSA